MLNNEFISQSELARPLSEKAAFGDCQPGNGLRIGRIGSHCITPPVETDSVVAQREENDDGRNSSSGIHGCLEQIYPRLELATYSQEWKLDEVGSHSCNASTSQMHACG